MIPYYFPHTYLSRRVIQILAAVFDRIGVYLPSELEVPQQMQRWVDSRMLELRIPVTAHKDRLAEVLKAFRSWASVQSAKGGFDLTLLKTYHSTAPFIDAPFASQIRTDIERRAASPSSDADGKKAAPDPLLAARIFLSIAQQLDEQADSLEQDLAAVDARRQDMLAELQDEQTGAPTGDRRTRIRADEHGQFMLTERILAWAQLAAAEAARSGPDAPFLFVTSSREALERIVDRLPEEEKFDRPGAVRVPVETSDPMASWRRAFLESVSSLAVGRPDPADREHRLPAPPPVVPARPAVRIEVIRFPRQTITEVLSAAGLKTPPGTAKTTAGNTVIVTVEPDGAVEI